MLTAIIASSAGRGDQLFLRWSDHPDLPVREEPVEVIGCDLPELLIRSACRVSVDTEVFLVGSRDTQSGFVRACRSEGEGFLLAIHIGSESIMPKLLPQYDPGHFAVDDFLTEEEEAKILESLKRGDNDRGAVSKRLSLLGLFTEMARKVSSWCDLRFQQRTRILLAYVRPLEVWTGRFMLFGQAEWWTLVDSNHRPPLCESGALTI